MYCLSICLYILFYLSPGNTLRLELLCFLYISATKSSLYKQSHDDCSIKALTSQLLVYCCYQLAYSTQRSICMDIFININYDNIQIHDKVFEILTRLSGLCMQAIDKTNNKFLHLSKVMELKL